MAGLFKPRRFFIFVIIINLLLAAGLPGRVPGQVSAARGTEYNPEEILKNEKDILSNLFILLQEIEEIEREQETVVQELDVLKNNIQTVRLSMESRQRNYDNKLDVLKQVLISYQRRGPTSYLDMVLQSRDFTSFLRNINAVKTFTRNVKGLLITLEEEKSNLLAKQEEITVSIAMLEAENEKLEETIEKKLLLKGTQEDYLISLKGEGDKYRERLAELKVLWEELKVLFPDIVTEFTRIIGEGKFPIGDLGLSYGLFNVKGTIYDDRLNTVYKENSDLAEILFHFHPGEVIIDIPEKRLNLKGTFSIEKGRELVFKAQEGSFYDMPLGPASIEELFKDGHLSIDFGKSIEGVIFQSIRIHNGYLEFVLGYSF